MSGARVPTPAPVGVDLPAAPAGAGSRIRVISVVVAEADQWFSEARRQSRWGSYSKRPDRSVGTEADRCRQAAITARHLGLPVGVIVRVREEVAV
mgnify:CR=1 FL=1